MNLFYKLWTDAINGRNEFAHLLYTWNAHPYRDDKWKQETIRNTSVNAFSQEHECLKGDTKITIRNKKTGVIEDIEIEDLYNRISKSITTRLKTSWFSAITSYKNTLGKIWITTGCDSKMINSEDLITDSWNKGRPKGCVGKRTEEWSKNTRKRMIGNKCAEGYKRTDSERKAISERMKGDNNPSKRPEVREKNRIIRLGKKRKPHTEETKQKMKDTWKRKRDARNSLFK